jgi:hypothetical protein
MIVATTIWRKCLVIVTGKTSRRTSRVVIVLVNPSGKRKRAAGVGGSIVGKKMISVTGTDAQNRTRRADGVAQAVGGIGVVRQNRHRSDAHVGVPLVVVVGVFCAWLYWSSCCPCWRRSDGTKADGVPDARVPQPG